MKQLTKLIKLLICHFRNEKRTGAEMYPAIVSGIVTGEAPVNFQQSQKFLRKLTRPSLLVSKVANFHFDFTGVSCIATD